MEHEEVQMNVKILTQVKRAGKAKAKRQRVTLNRYVENLIKKDLKIE